MINDGARDGAKALKIKLQYLDALSPDRQRRRDTVCAVSAGSVTQNTFRGRLKGIDFPAQKSIFISSILQNNNASAIYLLLIDFDTLQK